jgi:hypothetical protein
MPTSGLPWRGFSALTRTRRLKRRTVFARYVLRAKAPRRFAASSREAMMAGATRTRKSSWPRGATSEITRRRKPRLASHITSR